MRVSALCRKTGAKRTCVSRQHEYRVQEAPRGQALGGGASVGYQIRAASSASCTSCCSAGGSRWASTLSATRGGACARLLVQLKLRRDVVAGELRCDALPFFFIPFYPQCICVGPLHLMCAGHTLLLRLYFFRRQEKLHAGFPEITVLAMSDIVTKGLMWRCELYLPASLGGLEQASARRGTARGDSRRGGLAGPRRRQQS